MDLVWFLIIGLIGSVLMFSGDMSLYYSKDDYETDGTMWPVINIMKDVSKGRLYYGAMMGPISAFVYSIGYFHIVKMMTAYSWLGWLGFLCGSLGIIIGGAFHSHWVYYGRLGKLDDKPALEEVIAFCKLINTVSYFIIGVGFAVILLALVCGLTVFPRWVAIFSPGVLFLLLPLLKKLPKGLHMIICGGWSNLISVIYYTVAIVVCLVVR